MVVVAVVVVVVVVVVVIVVVFSTVERVKAGTTYLGPVFRKGAQLRCICVCLPG